MPCMVSKAAMSSRRGVFLDRDGTIITEVNYLSRPDQIRLIPGAIPALQKLQRYFRLVLITNQSGIAKGYFTPSTLETIHSRLEAELATNGIFLAGVYYCPHHPLGCPGPYRRACYCRKPEPGMLYAAAIDLNLDLADSFTIGDKLSDIEAGRRAGTRTGLVRTGYGRGQEATIGAGCAPWDFVGDDLRDAARWILTFT